MYGTQTLAEIAGVLGWFENDVKMYGTQTSGEGDRSRDGLRMM